MLKNNLTHLIYIPFRGVGIDFRDDKWFAERIRIFKTYTLASLKAQTNQNFFLWLSFRPQDYGNPLVEQLREDIEYQGFVCVFTYSGLMYWDDKFLGWSLFTLKNVWRVIRGCWRTGEWAVLPQALIEVFKNKNHNLVDRLRAALRLVRVSVPESDTVLLTRLDSDDMLHKEAVNVLQGFANQPDISKENTSLSLRYGYVYNGELVAEWTPKTHPPFHTLLFPSSVFFDAKQHREAYRDFKSHEDIPTTFHTYWLPDGLYCVNAVNPAVHISTNWNHPFRGRLVGNDVLTQFGL